MSVSAGIRVVDSVGGPEGREGHLFTADIEEYFHVAAFDGTVSRGDWDVLPSRVDRQVGTLLEMLAEAGASGTFFILGWVADRQPRVVSRIAEAGHEIASHGWWHRRIGEQERDEFREDVRSSKRILEDLTGQRVLGFRAANFSLVPGTEWALDILLEEGYSYDSSLFPVRWFRRGYAAAPRLPHSIRRPAGDILEVPPTTLRVGVRLPASGGAYFRHLPYGITRRALGVMERRGAPGVFYLHPWELDPDQPRLPVPPLARLRHYRNLERTEPRLRRLLREFRFASIRERLGLDRAAGTLDAVPALDAV